MAWFRSRDRRFQVTILVSGLHPYLPDSHNPGNRRRDYRDRTEVHDLPAYGYDDAVKQVLSSPWPGGGWSRNVLSVRPL